MVPADAAPHQSTVKGLCATCEDAKPPLGIMPRRLWEDRHWSEHQGPPTIEREAQRLVEVASAISRYAAAGLLVQVPIEWLKEVRAIAATIDVGRAVACRTPPVGAVSAWFRSLQPVSVRLGTPLPAIFAKGPAEACPQRAYAEHPHDTDHRGVCRYCGKQIEPRDFPE